MIQAPGRPVRVGRHIDLHLYDLDDNPCGTMMTNELGKYVISAVRLADQYCAFVRVYQRYDHDSPEVAVEIEKLTAFRTAYQHWLAETEGTDDPNPGNVPPDLVG